MTDLCQLRLFSLTVSLNFTIAHFFHVGTLKLVIRQLLAYKFCVNLTHLVYSLYTYFISSPLI